MLNVFLRFALVVLTLLLISWLVPGVTVTGLYAAVMTVIVLGIVNITLKPLLVVLTLPINILTIGLFTFVINAGLFWFVASFIKGFYVSGFLAAFLGAFVMTISGWIANRLLDS